MKFVRLPSVMRTCYRRRLESCAVRARRGRGLCPSAFASGGERGLLWSGTIGPARRVGGRDGAGSSVWRQRRPDGGRRPMGTPNPARWCAPGFVRRDLSRGFSRGSNRFMVLYISVRYMIRSLRAFFNITCVNLMWNRFEYSLTHSVI